MRKVLLTLLLFAIGTSIIAQQKIQLRATDKAECVKSDMMGLKANFSFSSLYANTIETTRGELSEIYIEGAFSSGNIGEPQLPMLTRLISIPTGATPVVTVGAYSETQYTLSDYGIGTVAAMQAPVRKNVDPSTVEYAFNETAYARDSYNDDPIAMVEVLGTMRGITLGRLIVQPIRYNPTAGTVKVFNDIEVNVDFQNGDPESTKQMFLNTFSPAFNSVYDQIFNFEMLTGGTRDVYTEHPDLYNTPVRMLVICYSGFQGNAALNSWLEWKLQKGYYVDIYYTGSGTNNAGTTSSAIATFIKNKYNASVSAGNAYTYLITIGDTGQVPYYVADYEDNDVTYVASDLGYASVDFPSNSNDVFPDMYYSRISVENTTHLTNYINKVLTYEKYEFSDGGNYLNNVILVGGYDATWTSTVAQPTINYATTYYFNSSNTTYGGFENGTIKATVSTSSTAGYSGTNNGCYQGINNGACFVNYTAHGDKQKWHQPLLSAKQVETLTNTGKYFFGVGNCCLTGNYNLDNASYSSSYAPTSSIGTTACFAETMIRVPNAGAIAYIGCSDYSIWMEDYYWALGSGVHFGYSNSSGYYVNGTSTTSNTTTGVYDAMFTDEYWNSASSLLYLGNIAVTSAENNNPTNGYDVSSGYKYYFKYYHTFGDGSVMPYVTKPETNTVTMPSTVTPGIGSITINALSGSYVAITDNNSIIYGVAQANTSGVATVNFTETIPSTGALHVVVTRQQYQPYFGTINIVGGTQYNITTTQPQHGTISAPTQAYGSSMVTLTATPETGYCLSNWTVTDANNNPITVTNNQFTMPSSAVTVTATFVPGLKVSLASVMNGAISTDTEYALQGNTINLTATPATGYVFDSWVVYKTGDINTAVTVSNNSFTMPSYPVTVSAIFNEVVNDDATIGSGTTTNNGQYLPTYAYYNYSLTQQIYTSSEVGSAGTITKVAFKVSNSKSTARNVDIYLSHTSNSSFSGNSAWVSQSTSYRVFSGSVDFASSGWTTITLDTPFEYNGTSNLLLTVDDNTGSYVSSSSDSPKFYTYSGSSNTAIYKYNDNTNYNPASMSTSGSRIAYKNQVIFTKQVPSTEGYLSVSSTNLTGFSTMAGTASEAQSIAVIGSNLQANLTVSAPTGFELSSSQNGSYNSSLTLTPSNGNVRANVFVRLSASASEGEHNGNLTLTSSTTSATVSLNGEVLPATATQTVTLSTGWNWFVPTVDMTLADLEAALGTVGIIIRAQNGKFVQYENGEWDGNLKSLEPGQMYRIQLADNCNLSIIGNVPSSIIINIVYGNNWFGYIGTTTATISQALNGFSPVAGDRITSSNGKFTDYDGTEWDGNLKNLVPGQGYIYISKDQNEKQLILQGSK